MHKTLQSSQHRDAEFFVFIEIHVCIFCLIDFYYKICDLNFKGEKVFVEWELSICNYNYFAFYVEGRILVLLTSVPSHCLTPTYSIQLNVACVCEYAHLVLVLSMLVVMTGYCHVRLYTII